MVSMIDSSSWLKRGNIKATHEAAYAFLQDRNIFIGKIERCPHCCSNPKTVVHLASRCEGMLGFDYMRRIMR